MPAHQSSERRDRRLPFKRRDIERTMRSAKAQGLEIGTVEVLCKDGTVIRVHAKDVRQTLDTPEKIVTNL